MKQKLNKKTFLKNPFKVEILRHHLAKRKKYNLLRMTYNPKFPEIKNINNSIFWSKKFIKKEEKSSMERERISKIIKLLIKEKGKLLDLGFGRGYLENEIVKNNLDLKLFGIDISTFAVESIKKEIKGKFIKGDVIKLPFRNNLFEIVVSLEIMEHISPSNTFKVLREIYRVLKKNGKLIISIPLNERLEILINEGENLSGHVRNYSKELIKAELEISGFELIHEFSLFAFKNLYSLKSILRKTIFKNRWKPNNIILVARKP